MQITLLRSQDYNCIKMKALDIVRTPKGGIAFIKETNNNGKKASCLLYTSDAADDSLRVDLGGRSIIKKKNFFQAEDGIRDS